MLVSGAALEHETWLRQHDPVLHQLHSSISSIAESGLTIGDLRTLALLIKAHGPDLICELGRGYGTSTALFRSLEIPVVSLCRTSYWQDITVPLFTENMPRDWTSQVNAIVGEIDGSWDYASLLNRARRPMIFWDAHGYDVADVVFQRILPSLPDRPILVACHDFRDSRYFLRDGPPDDAPLWRGQSERVDRFLRLGNVHSSFEQLVSVIDYTSWRGLPLCSPTHEIMTNPEALALFPLSGSDWPYCLWHYFNIP